MKAYILILAAMACSGMLAAAPPEQVPEQSKPEQDLGEVKIERTVKLEKAIAPEDAWTQSNHGVIGQLIEAPNLLDPVNPLAKPEAGDGTINLNRDPVSGRIMGLNLIAFDF